MGDLSFLFSNICFLYDADCSSNDEITVYHQGECKNETLCKACIWEGPPEPVCGSDGITYENKCSLKDANCESEEEISITFNGECPRACPMCDIRPGYENSSVCGTDGITYRYIKSFYSHLAILIQQFMSS